MVLIIYDSVFGNTEKVALAITNNLVKISVLATAKKVGNVTEKDIEKAHLIVLGSPTRAFQPSGPMKLFLKAKSKLLESHRIAIFDTRVDMSQVKSMFLHFMVKHFGYANDYFIKHLKRLKSHLVIPPVFFIVQGNEGPLAESCKKKISEFAKAIAKVER